MKHNKKRNTAFLYECLVKEMTKAAIQSDTTTKNAIASILKEHFNTTTVLHRELNLYKTLCEVTDAKRETAERILSEVKRVYHTLGEQEIFDEQSQVIKKVNTDLSKSIFNNFISNYKTLATISQMFSPKVSIAQRVILEEKVIDLMTSPRQNSPKMKPIDNITYNIFVQKFNEKYGSSLNESQKDLLSRYVTLSPETSTEFKLFINDEISRLKTEVKNLQAKREVILDESLGNKNREILTILENFRSQPISDVMIKTILKIQALVVEV